MLKKIALITLVLIPFAITAAGNLDSLQNSLKHQSGAEKAKTHLLISAELQVSKPESSAVHAMEAVKWYKSEGNIEGLGKAYFQLGLAYHNQQNYTKALPLLIEGEDYSRKAKDSIHIAYFISARADILEKEGNAEEAEKLHWESYGILHRNNEMRGAAIELASVGLIFWRRGENLPALELFKQAYDIRKIIGHKQGMAMALNNMGVVYWRMGDYEKAFQSYSESYDLRKEVNDIRGMIITKNNIGLIFLKLLNYTKAKVHFLESLEESMLAGYKFGQAYSNYNLADYHIKKKSYDSATFHANEAVRLYYSFKEYNSVANSLNYLGLISEGKGDFAKARHYYMAAIDTAKIINDNFAQATSYLNLANLALTQRDYAKALQSATLALQFTEMGKIQDLSSEIYLIKSEIYQATGNYAEAFKAQKKYITLAENKTIEQLNFAIANWQMKYELENIEKENLQLKVEKELAESNLKTATTIQYLLLLIVLLVLASLLGIYIMYRRLKSTSLLVEEKQAQLSKLNEELAERNEALDISNKTKDKLFSIISHDLTSPFQSILGNAELLLSDLDTLEKDEIRAFTENINKSSKILLELTKNLLTWSRLQLNRIQISLETLPVENLVSSIGNYVDVQAKLKNIQMNFNVEKDLTLVSDKQIISTALLNLTSNAIKFTDNGGAVTINAFAEPAHKSVIFQIVDSGIGIDKDTLTSILNGTNVESTIGTSNEKGTGLGILITRELVSKIGGEFDIKSTPGEGSIFSIKIPA